MRPTLVVLRLHTDSVNGNLSPYYALSPSVYYSAVIGRSAITRFSFYAVVCVHYYSRPDDLCSTHSG
jgi:hypothetical protein